MTERIIIHNGGDYGWIKDLPTYSQIVSTFGNIKAEASDEDYQGDSLYLIEKDGKYGILTFGWGSCSGCDALEAANSQADLDELQDDLERGIKWFEWDSEVLDYIVGGALSPSFLRSTLVIDFANKVKEALA